MVTVKEPWEIDVMRDAGQIVARGLKILRGMVKPGVTTADLDSAYEAHVRGSGATPTFKGYQGFPATVCTSLNEEVVHGIPSKKVVLKEGDLLKLDAGATYKGYVGDAAITVGVGRISDKALRLLDATREALEAGIATLGPGVTLGTLGGAIQKYAETRGFGVVRDFCGHGIGREMHEDPNVLNFVSGNPSNDNFVLQPGHVIAIEPMLTEGSGKVVKRNDNWTIATLEYKALAAHFEHTVAIKKDGYEVLTR